MSININERDNWYPREVYNIREDVTRKNKQDYDHKQNKLTRECLKLDPSYYSRTLRERMAIRQRVLNGLS